jgi:hypothetical protein
VQIRSIRDRFTTIESMVGQLDSNGGTSNQYMGDNITQELVDKVDRFDSAMFASDGIFERFKANFLDFKEQLESGGGVECNGIGFKSQRDFMTWFDNHNPKVDIFLDAIAFMHGIRSPVVHADDATKQMELQTKNEMGTGLEAAVLTSFVTILPSILVGSGGKRGDPMMGGTYAWLSGYLKKFEVWKPVGSTNGVSHQITTGVASVTKRVVELRKSYRHSDIILLSNGICTDSCNFCIELVRFINEQQEELSSNTSYTAEQIWQMQLECIQKIIEELSQAREGYGEAGRAARGNYVWGMLMAWKVQQRYLQNHFKDDPALTGILVRRILMQDQDTSVKKQLAKIDSNESKLESYKRENNSLVKSIKDEMSKLKDDLAKLKK